MEKSESKKLIPLYLERLFLEETDETHYIRMPQILSFLETKGICADRRTIYGAVSLLNTVGFEIAGVQEKGGYKYHHPSKLFRASELKFLADSVAVSKFLTERKSKELINKIKSLGSRFDGQALNRSVSLSKRIKSMNDKVLRNLDNIYAAIAADRQIEFQYLHWNPQRKLVSKTGKPYVTSPYAVTLADDRYYLIAFGGSRKELRHYHIDKMQSVKLLDGKREGRSLFQSFDIVDYSRKTFGMFGGREETVTLEVKKDLAGVFIDRFGKRIAESAYCRK
ncbi:MAG: WYL domain-containing protein [Lachnospiraceae bacterium]|nr:WYL domain-containing protein [Lachnospiraceae bacterium]